jgi:acyl transferase domain-containing protein
MGELYEEGGEIGREWLYEGEDHRRISLPTYPFAPEYFGLPEPSESELHSTGPYTSGLHPLLGRNVSTLNEARFLTRLSGAEFYLRDHKIKGRKILPAVAYLEMARKAGEIAGEKGVLKIRNVAWASPVALTGEEGFLEVAITLYLLDEAIGFEVSSVEKREAVNHASGTIIQEAACQPLPPFGDLNLEEIKERLSRHMCGDDFYAIFESGDVSYGESFRSVKNVYYNRNEALSEIMLPSSVRRVSKEFVLHLPLMDAALQTIAVLQPEAGPSRLYLPVVLEELEILSDLTDDCLGYAIRLGTEDDALAQIHKFDILILNGSGRVLVRMKNLWVKSLPSSKAVDQNERELDENADLQLLAILKQVELGKMRADEAERYFGENHG